jgi:hypothetical protein
MSEDSGDTIMVCPCVAADADFGLFMHEGCENARWVKIGHRIKPDELRGVPVSQVVCIRPDLVRVKACKFLKFSYLLNAYERMKAGPKAREFIDWSNSCIQDLRKKRGLS